MTNVSLLARSIRLPALAAAIAGIKPAAPTIAAITASTSGCDETYSRADIPHITSVELPTAFNCKRRRSAAASSKRTA